MVLHMYSITLYLSCLFIRINRNLVLRGKTVHFLIYHTYETKEHRKHTVRCLGKSVRSGILHLTSYIISQLHPFSVEKLVLFVLFHVRLD